MVITDDELIEELERDASLDRLDRRHHQVVRAFKIHDQTRSIAEAATRARLAGRR